MLFATKDKKLLEELAKENCSHLTPEEFSAMFQHATKEPHDFMMCDFKKNEVRRNFDEVLTLKMAEIKSIVDNTDGRQEEAKQKEAKQKEAN